MIVSDHQQFVFIHNPKCAGTAFRAALAQFDTTGNFFWMHDQWNGHKIDKAHLPLFVLQGRHPEYFAKLGTYFTFMVVRNPFTRTISAFNEARSPIYAEYMSTQDFSRYRYELNRFIAELTDEQIRGWTIGLRHFTRQIDFAYLGGKSLVDVVLKYENLPGALEKVRRFRPAVADALAAAPRIHQRPLGLAVEDLLDHQSIHKVVELYEPDFSLFDYSRSPLAARN